MAAHAQASLPEFASQTTCFDYCLTALALADAEREADDIRSGRRQLGNARFVLSLTEGVTDTNAPMVQQEVPLLELANRAAVADTVRKEVNVAKAVLRAEEELRNDPSTPPEGRLDDDWLYRWRDYAGSVSSDELQAIWGRILAGELKSPGIYSYRLLDFVRNLTKDEANVIERIAPFVFEDVIFRGHDTVLEQAGINFSVLLQLQTLGLISGVEALGMSQTRKSNTKECFRQVLLSHGRGLLVDHDDSTKTLQLGAYVVTQLGQQVMKLGKFVPNEAYLAAIGATIQKQGFQVKLIDYTDVGGGMIRCYNEKEIADSAQTDAAPPSPVGE